MLSKIVVILTMLLCSMATQVYALGLGTVTVESALNQPLRMRIELLQLGDTRLQDIRVSVASIADFERFNIGRDSFLSNIRFSVESTAQGNVVILTSSQIVREPYLSFILDTRWPNGRLLSEHTILLDLPVFDDQQSTSEIRQPISPILRPPTSAQATDAQPFVESSAAPIVSAPSSTNSAANLQPETISPEPVDEEVEPAQVEADVEEPAAQPATVIIPDEVPEEATTVAEEQPAVVEEEPAVEEPTEEVAEAEPEVIEAAAEPVEPEVVEPETIETSGSDTLSDIALQVRPNTVVSMQQTMLALQELNPEAFADGNINRLRSGQVLRVPSLGEIQSIDPRDAVDEVARQNQEFAEVDVQPLAAPANATLDQDDQPQGQLSVVSSDDAIDANSGAAELADAENESLDQRIAELEAQLAQRSEEADRARIEREELDSRMADLEAQIAAAQEIIRLQDMQLAQLQVSLSAAAVEAQLIAEQQAMQTAAAAEATLPVDPPSSLVDDVMRILTGNSLFILFGIVLVILLLVVLMLRRNRAAKTDDHDIDDLAGQDFDADAAQASTEDSEKDEAATELQDYDPSDLDSELDDIISVSGEAGNSEGAGEEGGATEEAPQLNVISIVEKLIGEQQYRRALIVLNTSLQEQGENEEVRAKISEVEHLLEAEQRETDESTKAEEAANRESETKSFLDDLGIDLDSFAYDDEANEPEVSKAKDEPASTAVTEEVSVVSDDVDMMFDLGDGDGAGESNVEELESDETETFEFDLDDDSNAVDSEAKDSEDLDIDTLEFDVNPVEEVTTDVATDEDEEIELETFAFDADATSGVPEAVEEKAEDTAQEADPNAVEFSFDADEIEDSDAAPQPVSNEEVEIFDFDLDDDDAGDTVLEKPDTEVTSITEDDVEDFDFDLDEFEIEPGTEEATLSDADADDDFLDSDAEAEAAVVVIDDEIEFDIDNDEEPQKAIAATEDDIASDDDLEFLSADDVEIESVDDIEEINMLSDDDETATKLELAYAYQNMGDMEGATEILQEVIKEGSDEQIEEASKLLGSLDGKSG
jgi:pilus assembly protein FimV